MPNYLRSCTDTLCLVLLALALAAYVGLLAYGLIVGDPLAVIAIHNSDGVRCNTNPSFKCTPRPTQTASSPTPAPSPTQFV
jgi:hypothetical protein